MKNLKDFILSNQKDFKSYNKESFASDEDEQKDEQKGKQKNEQKGKQETKSENIDLDQNIIGEAERLYEKYKDYSKEDLEQEFLSQSRQKIASGEMDKQKLSSTFSSLSPFLNDTQRKFLSGILEKIDE